MVFEIKHGMIQRDSLDESFELIDPNNYFKNENLLVAIDSDTLITIQILVKAIVNNDFVKWNEIKETNDIEPLSSLFVKLGYQREDIAKILSEI
jgi:hypothetical protein